MESAIYTGVLRHRRFRPVGHEFRYELFMAFLDIDRIPEVMSRSLFSSYNRFNWASFNDRDHFGDPRLGLRERLTRDAAAQGVPLPEGPIFLLTNLRYLGYNFNPISFYYCFDHGGGLPAILAEVNSTFGESHNYWLSAHNSIESAGCTGAAGAPHGLRFRCAKKMHVSPFMPMDLNYDFVLTAPGERLVAHMTTLDQEPTAAGILAAGTLFDATLTLERRPWTAGSLRGALMRHPWMTAKVIGGIHWEALRLYLKGAPVYTHPAAIDDSREVASKNA
jgi:DUF1365 family protein